MVAEMPCINARSVGEKCKVWMVQPVDNPLFTAKVRNGKHIDYLEFFSSDISILNTCIDPLSPTLRTSY
jgi:hypothetical protein